MKKSIFALFSILVIAISCKKDDPEPSAPVADKPYSNINDGTKWIYRVVTDSGLATQTSVLDTVTMTAVDTTINLKTYSIANNTNGNTKSYFNITANGTGNDYYQYQQVAALSSQVELLYLKDYAVLNETWTQQVPVTIPPMPPFPSTINLTLTSKITEIGGTRTIYGITYNDVITVSTTVTSDLAGITINSDIKNYYARNIGLIESNSNIDIPSVTFEFHNNTLLQFADLK